MLSFEQKHSLVQSKGKCSKLKTINIAKQMFSNFDHKSSTLKQSMPAVDLKIQMQFKQSSSGVCCNIQQNYSIMELSQSKSYGILNLNRKDFWDISESAYAPQNQKSLTKKPKKPIKNYFNNSTWTLQENLLYKDFLKKNSNLFSLPRDQRRAIKINVLISKYVKSRTSDQCRSHHQKMLIYHKNIESIVAYVQSLLERKEILKISKPLQSEQFKKNTTPNLEMKEIEEVKKPFPSLWDCIVDDVWQTLL